MNLDLCGVLGYPEVLLGDGGCMLNYALRS